ncbi:MAG: hypothetical protein ABSG31_05575 [Tepidisphaeraceae bacterium]|jgi:hypothetical protein
MTKRFLKRISPLAAWVFTAALMACAPNAKTANPNPPADNGGIFRERNEGYSLLYQLMSDNSRVGDIFIIKKADAPVGDLVKQIGYACQLAKKQMDDFPKSDKRIEYDVLDLPTIEQNQRDLTAQIDQKELLGSSGKIFELRLVLTQVDSTRYAAELAQALLAIDDDPARKMFLTSLNQQFTAFHDQLTDLVEVK